MEKETDKLLGERSKGNLAAGEAYSRARRSRLRERVSLGLCDLAAAVCSVLGAWWIWTRLLDRDLLPWHPEALIVLALFWPLALGNSKTLNSRLRKSILDDLPLILGRIFAVSMTVAFGMVLIGVSLENTGYNAGLVVTATGLVIFVLPVMRGMAYALLVRYGSHQKRRILIVGAGKVGARVADLISRNPRLRTEVVGFVDEEPLVKKPLVQSEEGGVREVPVLGDSNELGRIIRETGVGEVLIAFSTIPHERMLEMIWECDRNGVDLAFVPRLFEGTSVQSKVEDIGGVPLMHANRVKLKGLNAAMKRVFDVCVSLAGLLVIWPLLLAIALAVKLDSRGPIIFSQRRVGRDGKTFEMYKFRSMRPDSESLGTWTGRGDPRRTRVGCLIRALSLDELPQIFNVLKGDMSLVGPRPEQPPYVEQFEEEIYRYTHRHRIKAGVTGWAQVNGLRGDTSIEERVLFDNFYIENWSLWLDIKIIILTLVKAWFAKPELEKG